MELVGPENIENEIRRLRRNQQQLKLRIEELDLKEIIEEKRSLKRSREEPHAEVEDVMNNKRLKSVAVATEEGPVVVEEQKPEEVEERKPALRETNADKTRNRRLIGNLLLGTLNKIQKDKDREEQDERLQKRQEIVRTIDSRVQCSQESLWIKEKEKIVAEKNECKEQLEQIAIQILQKEQEFLEQKEKEYLGLLTGFVKTITKPEIYFLPSKLDSWTDQVFGLGTKENTVTLLVDENN